MGEEVIVPFSGGPNGRVRARDHIMNLWTPKQRTMLAVLVLVGVMIAALRWSQHRMFVADPQAGDGPRAREVRNRIDPNTAGSSALAVLPGIGDARAKAIVAYREEFLRTHPGEIAFRNLDDLMHLKDRDDESGVPGIGSARAEALRPYLIFPGEDPTKLNE